MQWTGSPKQIAWAKKIVTEFTAEMNTVLRDAEAADPSELSADAVAVIAEMKRGLERLQRVRSARWVIDTARVIGPDRTITNLADPEYKLRS